MRNFPIWLHGDGGPKCSVPIQTDERPSGRGPLHMLECIHFVMNATELRFQVNRLRGCVVIHVQWVLTPKHLLA